MTPKPDNPTIEHAQTAAEQLTAYLQRARATIVEAHQTVSMHPYLKIWGKATMILFVGYIAVLEYLYIRFPQAMGVEHGTFLADNGLLETFPVVFYGSMAVTGLTAVGMYAVAYLVATTDTEDEDQ